MTAEQPSRKLVPDPEVCRRYDIHPSTLNNWDNTPDLNFPRPVRIRKRKYRVEVELDRFDRERAAERDAEPP
jgi:hypothetical protein